VRHVDVKLFHPWVVHEEWLDDQNQRSGRKLIDLNVRSLGGCFEQANDMHFVDNIFVVNPTIIALWFIGNSPEAKRAVPRIYDSQ
jgi:hypothetical protein